jgi:hypothetical protein
MIPFRRAPSFAGVLLPVLAVVAWSSSDAQPALPLLLEMEGEADDDKFGSSVSFAGDVNNDGYDDWVVGSLGWGANEQGRFYLYLGGSQPDSIPDLIVDGESEYGAMGRTVAGVGDVNGDGYCDYAVTEIIDVYPHRVDLVRLYLGGDVVDGVCDLILAEPMPFCFTYGHAISHGDINHDTYDDVIVGAFEYDEAIWDGTSTGLTETILTDTTASWVPDGLCDYCLIPNVNTTLFGHWPYRLIVSNTETTITVAPGTPLTFDAETGDPYSVRDYRTGAVYVYLGGAPMDSIADLEVHGRQWGSFFGYAVAGAGDVNGDSYGDFVVGAYEEDQGFDDAGSAYLYLGGPDVGACGQPHMVINGGGEGVFLGMAVSGIGDFTGDGFCDFAVSVPRWQNEEPGDVQLYYGGETLDTLPDLIVAEGGDLGTREVCGADVNGDLCSDVVIGVPHDGDGTVLLYWGGESPDDVPDAVLGGEPGGYDFGNCVACAGDVDADGDCDVLVGTYDGHIGTPPPYNGKAFLFAGGSPTPALSEPPLPGRLSLRAFPNPFSSAVSIAISTFGVPADAAATSPDRSTGPVPTGSQPRAEIVIVDLKGRVVHEDLVGRSPRGCSEERKASGSTVGEIIWTPDASIGCGVYVVRAGSGDAVASKKVVRVK